MFISIRILDMGDPLMAEHLGYFRPERIIAVRPSQIMRNVEDVKQNRHILPDYKKFTTIVVDGIGNIPCSDAVDAVVARINEALGEKTKGALA